MADDTQLPPLVQPVTIDLTGLLEGLAKSKAAAQEHNEFWQRAGEVFTGIVGAEFSEAIKEMVKAAVMDFAKLDQAFDVTARTLVNLGGEYKASREKIEQYAEAVEGLTQFTKVETVTSLNNVLLKTRDYTAAVTLNGLAMDIVARNPTKNLLEVSKALALAFDGNSFGVRNLARELGLAGPAAKDATSLFAALEKQYHGAAVETENAMTESVKLKNELEKLSEMVGSVLDPALIHVSQSLRATFGNKEADLQVKISGATSEIERLKAILARGGLDQSVLEQINGQINEQVHLAKASQIELRKLKGDMPGSSKADIDALNAKVKANAARVKAETEAAKEEAAAEGRKVKFEDEYNKQLEHESDAKNVILTLDKNRQSLFERERIVASALNQSEQKYAELKRTTHNDGSKASLKHLAEMGAEATQIEKLKQELKSLDQERIAFAATLTGPVAASMQQYFDNVRAGTAAMRDAFAEFTKAVGKGLLGMLATFLEQKAAVSLAEGIGMAANPLTAAAAPGFFTTAALEAIGAGGIRSVAASLAKGGYSPAVDGGRVVQISEGGEDEIVSPVPMLRKLIAEGNGKGDTHNNQFVFPGVKKQSDVTPGLMKSAARQLFDEFNAMKIRSGQRAGFA